MKRLVDKIRFWDPTALASSPVAASAKPEQTTVVCADETIDFLAYHLCAYDPILGVLLCVGDNVPAIVLTRCRRRVALPVRKGARWLDCHIFAGTSSFLLLSPDCLLLVDYTQRCSASVLYTPGRSGALFACLHVPQGVTWGIIGCRDGSVMFWKLKHDDGGAGLVWAAVTNNLLEFCRFFLPPQLPELCGYIYAIDSNPTSPNLLVAVLSGVSGVCKWHMDENRLICFYSAPSALTNSAVVTCRVTPGGAYIVGTTFDLSTVFIWLESGKKSKNKCVEVFWVVDTGCRPSFSPEATEAGDAYELLASSCGIHIARGRSQLEHVQSDKKCNMHLLLYSSGELVELVLNMGGKQLIQREHLLPHVTALLFGSIPAKSTRETLLLQRVIPCIRSNYWASMWVETDLDMLLMTSSPYGPLLIQRCRSKRNVECVVQLDNFPRSTDLSAGMLLLVPPTDMLSAFWYAVDKEQDALDPWCTILRGVEIISTGEMERRDNMLLVGLVPDSPRGAVCLLPLLNEYIPVPPVVIEQHMTCWGRTPSPNSEEFVVLEQAIPDPPRCTEVILRVFSCLDTVDLHITHLTPPLMEPPLRLSKESLMPNVTHTDSAADKSPLVCVAVLVECRVERWGSAPLEYRLCRGGCSVLLQLRDASLVLVDLSCTKTTEKWMPSMVHYPSGLFPAGSEVSSYDTVWMDCHALPVSTRGGDEGEKCLALVCTLSDHKGVVVWDMCRARLLAYHPNTERNEWGFNSVVTYSPRAHCPNLVQGEGSEIVVTVNPGIVASTTTTYGTEGVFFLRDLFGRLLLPVSLCYGPNGLDTWCLKREHVDAEWFSIASLKALLLRFHFRITQGKVILLTNTEHSLGQTLLPCSSIAIVEAGPSWPFGFLHVNTPPGLIEEEEKERSKKEPALPVVKDTQCQQSIVLLCSDKAVRFFNATQLASSGKDKLHEVLHRFGSECVLEQVIICSAFHAVLVLTKDINKWRWLSLLDIGTAQHLTKPHAMIYFENEEKLNIYPVSIEKDGLHVYILGRGKVLGHVTFFVEDDNGVLVRSKRRSHFATGSCYTPAPSGFREYRRFLPPLPTMKQEQGFLKRLMTPPWEDVVLKLEEEVLQEERMESFDEFHQRLRVSVDDKVPPIPRHPTPEQERKELLQGSRYTELKSVAIRENVSLEEARRIMSKNNVQLQDRGERLTQIANKSHELAEEAATFQELARKLKEQQRNRWF